jgi:hypothetical protein
MVCGTPLLLPLLWLLHVLIATHPAIAALSGDAGLFSWCNGEKLPAPCAPGSPLARSAPWCDATMPTDVRVAALLGNLSVAEKAVLLATPGPAPIGSVTGPVPRLNYPKVHWWHEALVRHHCPLAWPINHRRSLHHVSRSRSRSTVSTGLALVSQPAGRRSSASQLLSIALYFTPSVQ